MNIEERERATLASMAAKKAAKEQPRVRLNQPPVKVGGPRPMLESPAKYCQTLEQNQKLNGCCRRMENLTAQYYRTATQPENSGPDLLIATCTCGRNHYRLMVGSN